MYNYWNKLTEKYANLEQIFVFPFSSSALSVRSMEGGRKNGGTVVTALLTKRANGNAGHRTNGAICCN